MIGEIMLVMVIRSLSLGKIRGSHALRTIRSRRPPEQVTKLNQSSIIVPRPSGFLRGI